MERLKALVIDVKDSVFDGDSEGLMYVVQDVYEAETVYVITMNTHSFSLFIRENHIDHDIEQSFKYEQNLFKQSEKDGLIKEIKRVIENWYELY